MFKTMVLLLIPAFFFTGCIVIPTYTAHMSLQTTEENTSPVTMTNVLVVGNGKVSHHVVFDNLAQELTATFAKKGVHSATFFLPAVPHPSAVLMDSLSSGVYDYCLVLNAGDSVVLNMTKEKFFAVGPGVSGTGYGNQFLTSYTISLFANDAEKHLVWQGDMHVDFDLANDQKYKKISKMIVNEMVKNGVLRG